MKKVLCVLFGAIFLSGAIHLNITAISVNYCDLFETKIARLNAFRAGFCEDETQEFRAIGIVEYTLYDSNIDRREYVVKTETPPNVWPGIDYYSIPADIFETEAKLHFNISDVNSLRNFGHDSFYFDETKSTYELNDDICGYGGGCNYIIYGYKFENDRYVVYGMLTDHYVHDEHGKGILPEGAVEGVDYIMTDYEGPVPICEFTKAIITYENSNVKFLTHHTIDKLPSDDGLITPDTPVDPPVEGAVSNNDSVSPTSSSTQSSSEQSNSTVSYSADAGVPSSRSTISQVSNEVLSVKADSTSSTLVESASQTNKTEESSEESTYTNVTETAPKKISKKLMVIIVSSGVVVLASGAAAVWFMLYKKKN